MRKERRRNGTEQSGVARKSFYSNSGGAKPPAHSFTRMRYQEENDDSWAGDGAGRKVFLDIKNIFSPQIDFCFQLDFLSLRVALVTLTNVVPFRYEDT